MSIIANIMMKTTRCTYCGEPISEDVVYSNSGEPYHRTCTRLLRALA